MQQKQSVFTNVQQKENKRPTEYKRNTWHKKFIYLLAKNKTIDQIIHRYDTKK